MKHLLSLAAGLILAIGVAGTSASADTIPLGNISPGGSASDNGGEVGLHPTGVINDTFTFTLTAASFISGNIDTTFTNQVPALFFADNFTAMLNGTIPLTLSGGSVSTFSYGGALAAGNYTLVITGTDSGAFGGAYTLNLSAVAATPIPAALVLFLTALGGLGAATWRRRSMGEASATA